GRDVEVDVDRGLGVGGDAEGAVHLRLGGAEQVGLAEVQRHVGVGFVLGVGRGPGAVAGVAVVGQVLEWDAVGVDALARHHVHRGGGGLVGRPFDVAGG